MLLLIKVVLVYRDDGLTAINNANGQKFDRIRKDVIALFKKKDFQSPSKQRLLKHNF